MRVVSKKDSFPQWGAGRRGAGRPAHSRPSSHITRSRRAADAAPRHAQRVAAARCPLPSAAAACIASHQRSTPATPFTAREMLVPIYAADCPLRRSPINNKPWACELRVRSWTTSWARAVSRHLICSPREGLCQSSTHVAPVCETHRFIRCPGASELGQLHVGEPVGGRHRRR